MVSKCLVGRANTLPNAWLLGILGTLALTVLDGCEIVYVEGPIARDGGMPDTGVDECPTDPDKFAPGMCGCGVPDVDTDRDRTADCVDMCPTDGRKIAPGSCGCGVADDDVDRDGVLGCLEECPDDPLKTEPGICGCGTADTDEDSDGFLNCAEACPLDPLKTEEGICGCGMPDVDTDLDSALDCQEECPDDPLKTAAGICGCGIPDADSDSDGSADCVDECDNDPLKSAPGMCGCGVTDADTDTDGFADCVEECDTDANKQVPGVCGCGVADTDSDNDGVADCRDRCPGAPDTDSDGDGTPNCIDGCPNDRGKLQPGICGCGVADTDTDGDLTPDCNDLCDTNPNVQREGTITFAITFDATADTATYRPYQNDIRRCLEFAGAEYARYLRVARDTRVDIVVEIDETVETARATSTAVYRIASTGPYHQSVAFELIYGRDPDTTANSYDARIVFGGPPLRRTTGWTYWFDPDPSTRTAAIPTLRVDAMSTCLHEMGHMLFFNGFRDATTWLPRFPGQLSVYDQLSADDGANVYFNGPSARQQYGGPVWETYNSPVHLGNLAPRPGIGLQTHLMRGVATPETSYQYRFSIDALMLAFLADGGLPVAGTPADNLCNWAPGEPRAIEEGPTPSAQE